jgi:YfiR/HmsC-like
MALLTQRCNPLSRWQGVRLRRFHATGSVSHQRYSPHGNARLVLGIMLCAVMWGALAVPADVTVAREYQVKAIFLYNFAQFVTWPVAAFPERHTPITIGILGDDPFGPFLEEAVRGEVIEGRSLTVKHFTRVEEVIDSHILFISKSERGRVGQILAAVRGKSILTVGETEAFARQGGIINFITTDHKVRYEINVDAAKRADLDISSKLLRLAKIVGYGGGN